MMSLGTGLPPRSSNALWVTAIVVVAVVAMLAGSALTLLLLPAAGIQPETPAMVAPVQEPEPEPESISPGMQRFINLYDLVLSEFVDEIEEDVLWDGAASGLLRAVGDPYTAYMDIEGFRELLEHTSGSYVGIGITLTEHNEAVMIIAPFPDSPARAAGLQPGDEIIEVDGRSLEGMPLDAVVALIRGEAGTEVELTVLRNGEPLTVPLKRAVINIPTVAAEYMDDEIGYIRISQFTRVTPDAFRSELDELLALDVRGLIIDLRFNPGGDLDACLAIAGMLVPQGPIVHTVDRDGVPETRNGPGPGLDIPIAVLINQGSASSSEILAAAIRDRTGGALIGRTSFGKASVQTLYPLDDGAGVKLTTARYLTPDGDSIDGNGLEPDIEVEAGDEGDAQLEAAVSHLKQRMSD